MEDIQARLLTEKGARLKEYLKNQDVKLLEKVKVQLDDLYYNTGDSIVSDENYDILKDILSGMGKVLPVGAKLREGENRAELPFWLGSADKITPNEPEVLKRWLVNNRAGGYIVSEKLDGVSCLLIFDGKLKLYTRGDGVIGADISNLASYFKIPKLKEHIAIRGELIIKKRDFENKHKNTYKNPRNMVSGLISGKTVRKGLEDVQFVTYEIVGDGTMDKPGVQMMYLQNLGFQVAKHEEVKELSIANLSALLKKFKAVSEYEIDGIIVQSNLPYDRNTSGNPDYTFAFKMLFEDAVKETVVLSVEWNISKWGQLKPVVIVEPVELSGVTITRATAHNAKYVEDNSLGAGSIIKITRSKDVIPYIVEVVSSTEAEMPDIPYTWDKTHVNISVEDFQENTICVKLIAGIFEKLGIKHVSEATVSKMFEDGLDNFFKIITADKERLLRIPEFQERSAERIYTNIRNGLENVKISTILGASGVLGFGVGRKRIDVLLLNIPDILEIYKTKSREQMKRMIMQVEGFSDIMAEKIVKNLKYADQLITKLGKYATFREEKRVSDNLVGQKFVMSGFRDKELEQSITERGGQVTGTVTGKTSGLILQQKTDKLTGKPEKAQQLGIPIYSRDEFIQKFLR